MQLEIPERPSLFLVMAVFIVCSTSVYAKTTTKRNLISDDTLTCIGCHSQVTPGIVESWRQGLHSMVIPAQAMKMDEMHGGLSSKTIPAALQGHVVGCAECHTLNPKAHADTFEHNGFQVHVIVTPKDCATCHKKEVEQFSQSLMGKAYVDLMGNPTYKKLIDSVNGMKASDNGKLKTQSAQKATTDATCLACHGTKVEVAGRIHRETSMGDMDFPKLTGWPNQGVGRINPDGSAGSCSACHSRHAFSVQEARNPSACERCHKGPDTPAYKVYMVSKHGAIYKANHEHWNMTAKPWVAGKDFDAPTCATCHISGVVNSQGEVLEKRTHNVDTRLSTRIFGLPYSHPQPLAPDTSTIKNKAGLYLITNLDGSPVKGAVISPKEQAKRRKRMQKLCLNCHSASLVDGHFKKIDHMNKWADNMVKISTGLMVHAWKTGIADPTNPFDEYIEKLWVETWLFYANSVRFAAAMSGADYGVFAHGSWYLSRTLTQMKDWTRLLEKANGKPGRIISPNNSPKSRFGSR